VSNTRRTLARAARFDDLDRQIHDRHLQSFVVERRGAHAAQQLVQEHGAEAVKHAENEPAESVRGEVEGR
jgi:hypothetical protein